MTRIGFFALLITCFLSFATVNAEPIAVGKAASSSNSLERRVYRLSMGQTRIELGRSFIVPESDTVMLDGRLLKRGDDYRINFLRGTIILLRAATGNEILEVRFSRWPFPFDPVFVSNIADRLAEGSEETRIEPVPGRVRSEEPTAAHRLNVSGSKTVGISIGTAKDLSLDQSLKLTMVGEVAKDLEIKAYLTDDDLPVQPFGNTEELKQLDRVLVQVKSKHSRVELGDFSSSRTLSSFSSFKRDLRGLAADVGIMGQSYEAGAGMARGRFKTVRMVGRDGVQGPYELLPAQRFNSVTILAGTEAVYCNGRLLRRGYENDYVIDYGRGTVTFTERVPITADTEIVVDFEISEFGYRRSTVFSSWNSSKLRNVLSVKASFFEESDDRSKPLSGNLSEQDKESIASAGDDPDSAITPGVELVEPGKGDYLIVAAGTDTVHFVFSEENGEYKLEFLDAGPGKGDYATDGFSSRGFVKYRWVGSGKGSFRIGRKLPLPERKRIFSLGASGGSEKLYFEAEGAASEYDRNIFSAIDDNNNTGVAFHLSAGIRDHEIAAARVSLLGEYSQVGRDFSSVDRLREAYFYRDWGLEDEPLEGAETIAGTRLSVIGVSGWNAAASYERLTRGSHIKANKSELTGALGSLESRGLAFRGMISDAGRARERRFAGSTGAFAFWHLLPKISLESEHYLKQTKAAVDTGRDYRQGTVSIAARDVGQYRMTLSFSRRMTDLLDTLSGDWFEARQSDELSVDGGYSKGSRLFELLASQRRNREFRAGNSDTYNLARLRFRDSWPWSGFAADLSYRISRGEERTIERSVVFVGEKQGDYDASGREVGQKRGDYMLVYVPGAALVSVNSVELSFQASFGAGIRGVGRSREATGLWSRLSENFSWDHLFSVIEKSRTEDLASLFLLRPSLLQRDDLTLYGATKIREECTLFGSSRIFKLRISYSREDEEDNRTEGSGLEFFSRDLRVRAETAAWDRVALSLESRTSISRRSYSFAQAERYNIETVGLSQETSYRLGPSTRFSLSLEGEARSDDFSSARQKSFSLVPSFSTSLGARFNCALSFRMTYTDDESPSGKPLFFLEQGWRQDWSLIAQYRASNNISFGLTFTGRREKDYIGEVTTVNDLKVESRAYF